MRFTKLNDPCMLAGDDPRNSLERDNPYLSALAVWDIDLLYGISQEPTFYVCNGPTGPFFLDLRYIFSDRVYKKLCQVWNLVR